MTRYSEKEGVREKEMKGESTDHSMVKAAVEGGEKAQYASKVRKASRQVTSMAPRLKLHLKEASRWNKALGKSDLDAQFKPDTIPVAKVTGASASQGHAQKNPKPPDDTAQKNPKPPDDTWNDNFVHV